MGTTVQRWALGGATLMACCVGVVVNVHAGPAVPKAPLPSPAPRVGNIAHLDLRLPAAADSIDGAPALPGAPATRRVADHGIFAPSTGWAVPGASPSNPPGRGSLFSRLDAELPRGHATNTVAEMTQRFHHEGLPIARLWESHRALLSFGLNQRGKPGLWLVQKTH